MHEKKYYKLKWRLQGIDICLKHNNWLLQKCAYCKEKIKYADIDRVGYCPYCFNNLQDQVADIFDGSSNLHDEQRFKEGIINELLVDSNPGVESRELGLKVLYLIKKQSQHKASLEKAMVNINHLLQYARGTMSTKRSLHLSILINILYTAKLTYKELLILEVPEAFSAEICNRKNKSRSEDYVCQALWCPSYLKIGSLVKTGTRSKYKGENRISLYMYCQFCGCEYAISKGVLFERSNFIKGYYSLKNDYTSALTWSQISRFTGFSLEKNRRILAYFRGRGLLTGVKYDYNEQLVMQMIESLKIGINLTTVQGWSCWESREQYLIYRYHPQVMTAIFKQPFSQPARLDRHSIEQKLVLVCNEFIATNQKITNKAISKAVCVSSNTLNKWGLQEYINNMKYKQKMQIYDGKIISLKRKIDDFFNEMRDSSITIADIYRQLNLSQTYLHNFAPEINNYIRDKKNNCLSQPTE
ncbi:hypothetical protein HMSSN036_48740 [Paenibacillus macerans]|nr:hypothetical protein HMSSN036_48740 [Paenibacillus macerans]